MHDLLTLLRRFWAEGPVYLYAAVCGVAYLAIFARFGASFDPEQARLSFAIFEVSAVAMFFTDLVWRLVCDRPQHPLRWARARYFSVRAALVVLGGLPAMALCIVMIPMFSSLKTMIPLFNPFGWDQAFIEWDRAIFLGQDAWQVLQPVLGYPAVTAGLALTYHLWTFLLYPGCIFIAFYASVGSDLKRRFFLSYAMAWTIVGGVMATFFASVGPVFAKALVGIDRFEPQLGYLRAANEEIPVWTVAVQDMLLARFAAGDSSLGSGISAMPSMHVAIAALFWLAMREVSPRAGRWFLGFLAVIWIGSVHLAYHYAVDGLVSLIAVFAIWKVSALVFAGWDKLRIPVLQPALRTNTLPTE